MDVKVGGSWHEFSSEAASQIVTSSTPAALESQLGLKARLDQTA